jgi:hypothetical protein
VEGVEEGELGVVWLLEGCVVAGEAQTWLDLAEEVVFFKSLRV